MVLLENDQFLTELTMLYHKASTAGTVVVTMKRYDGRTKPTPRNAKKIANPPEPKEYKCLIRAVMGSKKLSTVISAKDLNKFQLAYSNLSRGNIELKKKNSKQQAKNAVVVSKSKTKKPAKAKKTAAAQKMDTQ